MEKKWPVCKCGCNLAMHKWLSEQYKHCTNCRVHDDCDKYIQAGEQKECVCSCDDCKSWGLHNCGKLACINTPARVWKRTFFNNEETPKETLTRERLLFDEVIKERDEIIKKLEKDITLARVYLLAISGCVHDPVPENHTLADTGDDVNYIIEEYNKTSQCLYDTEKMLNDDIKLHKMAVMDVYKLEALLEKRAEERGKEQAWHIEKFLSVRNKLDEAEEALVVVHRLLLQEAYSEAAEEVAAALTKGNKISDCTCNTVMRHEFRYCPKCNCHAIPGAKIKECKK